MDPLSLLWLFFILASMQPAFARQVLLVQRRRALAEISRERQATVITLIHRQETMSLFGFPLVRYIDIDDAAGLGHVFQVLRNHLTGNPTHPYNIHQILIAHQHLDPGYRLIPGKS